MSVSLSRGGGGGVLLHFDHDRVINLIIAALFFVNGVLLVWLWMRAWRYNRVCATGIDSWLLLYFFAF